MEVLRTSLFLLIVLTFQFSFGQDNKAIQSAFENSFLSESKEEYKEGISFIKSVYSDNSYPSNLRLGWLYYLEGNYNSSLIYYKRAIKLMPAATEPFWGIINTQIALDKWGDVEKSYLSILRLDPKNKIANYKLGLIYYYRKNYTAAKQYFDIALNLFPFDYDALLMSAWNNYFLGKSSEAKVLFNRVLLLYKNDSSALGGLSLIK